MQLSQTPDILGVSILRESSDNWSSLIQPVSYISLTTTTEQQLAVKTAELALQSSQQFISNILNRSSAQIIESVTSLISPPETELEVTKNRGRPKLTQYVVDQRAAAK